MSITPYAIGGAALVVGLSVGYVKWIERGAAATEARADMKTAIAECTTNTAADVNASALDQVAALTAEVERQKQINLGLAAKAGERLRANNRLTKEIANVKDNPPVPDAIERILESERLRSAVPGPSGSPASGADENGGPSPPDLDRRDMPDPATPTS